MDRNSVRLWFGRAFVLIFAFVVAASGAVVLAQEPVAPAQYQEPAAPPQYEQAVPPQYQVPPQAGPPQQPQVVSPQQLDDLVAPIALYPDPLLGQVLVASTYPLEVAEAQQWLQANRSLQGQQLMDAARQQNWDPSVQALVAFPDVLARLTQDIRWTTDLGNAFLAQQADVMNAVQRLRARAQANGRLQSTPQESVTTQDQGGQSAIEIQPANPQEMYVPNYDPNYVWGPPPWGFYYPPLYYPAYGFGFGPGIDVGLFFGGWGGWGFGIGGWGLGVGWGWGWGWGPNWFGRGIFVNNFFFNRYGFHGGFGFGRGFGGASAWVHDPSHRLGVAYPNRQLSSRFGAASQASRMAMGRSGVWRASGSNAGNFGSRNSFRASAPQAYSRNSYASGARNSYALGARNSFASGARNSYASGARNSFASRGSSTRQSFQGGRQSYQAPAQRSQAPQQHFQPGSRMSASSYRGGGGSSRSFSGGGGFHSSGGGGGFHGGGGGSRSGGGGSHGGGGHGGGRRK